MAVNFMVPSQKALLCITESMQLVYIQHTVWFGDKSAGSCCNVMDKHTTVHHKYFTLSTIFTARTMLKMSNKEMECDE